MLPIVIATLAVGMGWDCPNVCGVKHRGPSGDIEQVIQDTDRAGRDCLPSQVILWKVDVRTII